MTQRIKKLIRYSTGELTREEFRKSDQHAKYSVGTAKRVAISSLSRFGDLSKSFESDKSK
jgi:hypothetical protein